MSHGGCYETQVLGALAHGLKTIHRALYFYQQSARQKQASFFKLVFWEILHISG